MQQNTRKRKDSGSYYPGIRLKQAIEVLAYEGDQVVISTLAMIGAAEATFHSYQGQVYSVKRS